MDIKKTMEEKIKSEYPNAVFDHFFYLGRFAEYSFYTTENMSVEKMLRFDLGTGKFKFFNEW